MTRRTAPRTKREYNTFPTDRPPSTMHSNPNSVAYEAQRLASQGSWADTFAPRTPTTRSSSVSSVDDERYERFSDSEPPPEYTPSESNASQPPSSPAMGRPEMAPTTAPPAPSSNIPSTPVVDGAPRLQSSQPIHVVNIPSEVDEDLIERSHRRCGRSPWWSGKQQDGCHGTQKHCRAHRFKRVCLFTTALMICLWLLVPGLFYRIRGSLPDTDRSDWPLVPPEQGLPAVNREYRQHETSQAISGNFDLYDLLELTTQSASISANINLHPGDKPAVLILSTRSGSIDFRINNRFLRSVDVDDEIITPGSLSNRTFKTTVTTNSGHIKGNLIHGNGGTTSVRTTSASIDLDIDAVGVGDSDPISVLSTSTSSGRQDIRVSASDPYGRVSKIKARHHVVGSGSMDIRYPSEWVGKLHVSMAGSGNIQVDGSDLEYDVRSGREVLARRGEGDLATVEVAEQGSGSIEFSC